MTDLQTLFGYLTPISLTVGVFYYIMSLRNQNKARKTQIYMQIMNRASQSDHHEASNKYSNYEWSTPEDFIKDLTSLEGRKTIGIIGSYYESLGILVRENLLDIRVVALFMTGNILNFWNKLMPIIDGAREALNWPRLLIETEYLYNELMKYIKEHPEIKT